MCENKLVCYENRLLLIRKINGIRLTYKYPAPVVRIHEKNVFPERIYFVFVHTIANM